MSKLLYIRHAQASFMRDDYDQLSKLGEEQSRLLGQHLLASEVYFDKIYVGPLKRQWQTYELVAKVYAQNGLALPEPVRLAELNEHQATEVLAEVMPQFLQHYEKARRWNDAMLQNPQLKRRNYLRIFHYFMGEWAKGNLIIDHPSHLQNWSSFRQRVKEGLEKIISDPQTGLTVAAFTSGGTVSAAIGHALEMINEERVIELNARVKNTSITEFLFSRGKITLSSFNEIVHLTSREMITYV